MATQLTKPVTREIRIPGKGIFIVTLTSHSLKLREKHTRAIHEVSFVDLLKSASLKEKLQGLRAFNRTVKKHFTV